MTLSAHAAANGLSETVAYHSGNILAAIALSACVYFCYGYAPKLIKAVSASTVHGILRIIAFILMCIGVQIAGNGIAILAKSLLPS